MSEVINTMNPYDDIIEVLQKNKYTIDDNARARVRQLLECLKDDNQFHTLDKVQQLLKEQRDACTMQISEIGINKLEKWKVDSETGDITHESGGFFSVVGIRVANTVNREVGGWTQPIIKQVEGILGILCCNFNGVRHYLINAKAEPGNIHKLQLSPTVQATFSNLKQLHGGKKTKFAEFFEDTEANLNAKKGIKVLYSQWLAEDGGRFYLKVNKNMLVEIDESIEIEVPFDYIWLTMYQIKQLLKHDNLVGPHVRSIIAHL